MKAFLITQIDPNNEVKVMDTGNVMNMSDDLHDVFHNSSANLPYNGATLYAKLNAFNTLLSKNYPSLSSSLISGDNEQQWIKRHFENKRFFTIYTTLSQLELEVATLETGSIASKNINSNNFILGPMTIAVGLFFIKKSI